MPFKLELNAVKKNYVKLMKLPVKDLLPAMKVADIVSDDQREQMNAMTLDKERAEYLVDEVIIPSLKLDIREPFDNFLQVLEDDDNPVVIAIVKSLKSYLVGSIPPQRKHSLPHQPYSFPVGPDTPKQPYPYIDPSPGQPYPGQPYPGQTYSGQSYPVLPSPEYQHRSSYFEQSYPGSTPGQPYPGQPYPGQAYNGQPNQEHQPSYSQQPYPGGQPYPGQPYTGQPYPGQAYTGQPYPGQAHTGQPYPGQGYNGQAYSGHPYPQGAPEAEKVLARSSKKGIDPLPANNRNLHAVCLIKRETRQGTEVGTGFIAKLTMPKISSPVTVLVTNHHVIHNLDEALDSTYEFSFLQQDSDSTPDMIHGQELIPQNSQGFFTCMESVRDEVLLDYTMIIVHERPLNDTRIKSELDGETFSLSECKFDLDKPAVPSGIEEMETVSILHYPRGMPLKRSTQGSINVGHLLFYSCDTDGGSSGAPVLKVVNKRLQVIALHRGSWEGVKFNFGTLITDVLNHVNNEPAAKMNKWDILTKLEKQVTRYSDS